MGLRPTQDNEKRLDPASTLHGTVTLSLSSRPERRDLRFRGPFVEMFFDRGVMGLLPTQGNEKRLGPATTLYEPSPSPCHPERSRGICSSADLSWKCFSTERSVVMGPAVFFLSLRGL
jgi:hypothetical protein